jgi:MFS family permease
MVLFEVPTGVVADTWGRRTSYLLGTLTLAGSTLLYWLLWQTESSFWLWAIVSILIGLGFTFFSGAVEAWLVDALRFSGYEGELESVFGRGQMVMGAAMLGGSVAGGVIAQATSLGVPFLLRVGVLVVMFGVAWAVMRDVGFTPQRSRTPLKDMHHVLTTSIEHGLGNPPVRWVMLAAPFSAGVGIYTFYALQPFLLDLYGDPNAYSIAGLAAAILAGAQILGGWLAPRYRGLFARRTSALLMGVAATSVLLMVLALTESFALALAALVAWGLIFAMEMPIRQAYLNGMIPSERRATVLSFDSLMGNTGGVVIQPVLGKSADVWSYGTSYAIGGAFQALALPFLWLSRREDDASDKMRAMPEEVTAVDAV